MKGKLGGNILRDIPEALPNEISHTLLATDSIRIERIVSRGHASPEGFWYDQQEGEWVIVLQGAAGLRLEGTTEEIIMHPGDYLHIRPRLRHRVEWTAEDRDTIWLAIYYKVSEGAE